MLENATTKDFFQFLQIAGHSLGGSLAAMAAVTVASEHTWPSAQVSLVTFGEPRTGDVAFATTVNVNTPFTYR